MDTGGMKSVCVTISHGDQAALGVVQVGFERGLPAGGTPPFPEQGHDGQRRKAPARLPALCRRSILCATANRRCLPCPPNRLPAF
jgi:hypothetical protein